MTIFQNEKKKNNLELQKIWTFASRLVATIWCRLIDLQKTWSRAAVVHTIRGFLNNRHLLTRLAQNSTNENHRKNGISVPHGNFIPERNIILLFWYYNVVHANMLDQGLSNDSPQAKSGLLTIKCQLASEKLFTTRHWLDKQGVFGPQYFILLSGTHWPVSKYNWEHKC